jgi:hypothetical protein
MDRELGSVASANRQKQGGCLALAELFAVHRADRKTEGLQSQAMFLGPFERSSRSDEDAAFW